MKRIAIGYDTHTYEEFAALEKQRGLDERYWDDLPKMWENELLFRKELEDAVNNWVQEVQAW